MTITHPEQSQLPTDQLVFPDNGPMYHDHLERSGLIRYDMLKPMEAIRENGRQIGGRNFLVVKLTELGATLMRAPGFPQKPPA